MSDIIQLLPDSVANQIAAGEVIQRPASVIKELVENAVDAGATAIDVLVVDAGRTSIQVVDNGKGMSETDARLSFERHATSKIRQADDLFALHSMGFRGEALASIAAVAQVELKTRTASSDIGTHISIAGSKVISQTPEACPVGCNFTIENLFFNVPARRKFLKSNTTEMNQIVAAFERIVLVYPNIAFTLYNNGTETINLRPSSLRQRIADVFGRRISQDLLPIDVDTTLCRISGFVGKPEAARKKGVQQFFFVNGRYMKHPYFHKAVMNAFDRLVAEGAQVPYFIYFDITPADIDVNIHPTKTEIKFENEQAIWQILSAAAKTAIGVFRDIPSIDFDTEGRPDIPLFDPTLAPEAPTTLFNPTYNPFNTDGGGQKVSGMQNARPFTGGNGQERHTISIDSRMNSQKIPDDWQKLYEEISRPRESDAEALRDEELPMQNLILEDKSPIHYQYKGRYIMTAVKSGLMIIDQHRADIRIRYEHYLNRLESQASDTQRLLFPETLTLPPSQQMILEAILPEMTALGFELTSLGGGTYAINGVPAGITDVDSAALVMGIIEDSTDNVGGSLSDIHKTLALSVARNMAIPQGQVMGNGEMENMVNELFACSNANYTPDGKTIICILPQQEIERLFA